jgi:hypothetical protein
VGEFAKNKKNFYISDCNMPLFGVLPVGYKVQIFVVQSFNGLLGRWHDSRKEERKKLIFTKNT